MHVILYELTIHSLLIITKYNYNYSFEMLWKYFIRLVQNDRNIMKYYTECIIKYVV